MYDSNLGDDWGSVLTSALQAGASVYATKQGLALQTAQLQQQLAQRQVAAPLVTVPAGLPAGVGAPVMVPPIAYDAPFASQTPGWLLPAAIGAGVLLLVLLLRR